MVFRTGLFASLFFMLCGSLPALDYGPPIGGKVPTFELPDQDGKTRDLRSLLGPKGAILVFYRSADW